MSFVGPGQVVTASFWKQFVQQFGLGDTSTPGTEEIRLFKDGSEYVLKIWTGTAWVKVTRSADLLNNQADTYFLNAGNLNAGTLNLDRIPSTLTGKDADKLDSQHGSYYRDASNLNAGTLSRARLSALWIDNESSETTYPFIQSGNVQGVGTSPYTRVVTFSVAYSATPIVVVGNGDNTDYMATGHCISKSTTGFTFFGRYTQNYFQWISIGKKI